MTDMTEIAEMIDPVTGELIDHRRLAEQLLEQANECASLSWPHLDRF